MNNDKSEQHISPRLFPISWNNFSVILGNTVLNSAFELTLLDELVRYN